MDAETGPPPVDVPHTTAGTTMAIAFGATAGALLLAAIGCYLVHRASAARRSAKFAGSLGPPGGSPGGPGGDSGISSPALRHLYASGPTHMLPQPRPSTTASAATKPGASAASASSIELGRSNNSNGSSRGDYAPSAAPSNLLPLSHRHSGPGA
ncbi:hypothetical protein FOA52_007618 [Chlamydomonas sp. UWO 241]|nr:hypothetical protein FOA52_007618 [Chlamydomonas sp. UWO 241]